MHRIGVFVYGVLSYVCFLATFLYAVGFVGGFGVPRSIDAILPYDKHLFGPSLFLFSFYIFINIHHYFLDNVMWRRGNPDVQQYIFKRPGAVATAQSPQNTISGRAA